MVERYVERYVVYGDDIIRVQHPRTLVDAEGQVNISSGGADGG
jgi:hypothetical protein